MNEPSNTNSDIASDTHVAHSSDAISDSQPLPINSAIFGDDRPGSSVKRLFSLPAWFPPLFFLCLGLLFFWKSLFGGDVFLPAGLLGHLSPWKQTGLYPTLPPWNPLRWDGIGQFYPWRHFSAETIRTGRIPLWNPYQFGGTPFVANSQSAVLYPGNSLFYLIPDTARAFAWSALLHTTLCGWFTYLFLRTVVGKPNPTLSEIPPVTQIGCSEIAALLGGVVYTFSFWQVAWMQLPTFLATSCWLPLLLRQVYFVITTPLSDRKKLVAQSVLMSLAVGMMLLAGHLQIAFYGILAATLWGLSVLGMRSFTPSLPHSLVRIGLALGAFVLGLMLALPQLLPSIELSRMSHRAGKPTAEGYKAYTEYGLPLSGIALMTLPEIFGGDTDPANPYWGFYEKRLPDGNSVGVRHNLAETAIYVGILPLFLGSIALFRLKPKARMDWRVLFFALLAILSLLMSLGTPIDALFYFGIPGFGQSGSPARCLVLWAFACACLSAFGFESLRLQKLSRRELLLSTGSVLLCLILGLAFVGRSVSSPPLGLKELPSLPEILSRNLLGELRFFVVIGVGIFIAFLRGRIDRSSTVDALTRERTLPMEWGLLAIATLDLFLTGMGVNPTAKPEQVYPVTKGIEFLQREAKHDYIAPINQLWSLYVAPPDVLPPNAGMVYHLRDMQGYDSLFFGKYKATANHFARPNRLGALDASPPEVGNMVFIQDATHLENSLVKFAITVPYGDPGFAEEAVPHGAPLDTGDSGMSVYAIKGKEEHTRAEFTPNTPSAQPILVDSQNDYNLQWVEDSPTRVTLGMSLLMPGELSLRGVEAPGWKVTYDEKPVEFGNASHFDRTVKIPSNDEGGAKLHRISFYYDPTSFRLGLYLSLFSCLILAVAGTVALLEGRGKMTKTLISETD